MQQERLKRIFGRKNKPIVGYSVNLLNAANLQCIGKTFCPLPVPNSINGYADFVRRLLLGQSGIGASGF